MGVKSTVTLTREEAIARYVRLLIETKERELAATAMLMSNRVLEDVLETVNDEYHDGEGFENYMIKD